MLTKHERVSELDKYKLILRTLEKSFAKLPQPTEPGLLEIESIVKARITELEDGGDHFQPPSPEKVFRITELVVKLANLGIKIAEII